MNKLLNFPFFCFILSLIMFTEQDFGFVPLNNPEGFGHDLIPAIAFTGAIWFIFDFIRALKNKSKKSEIAKAESK